MIWLAIAVEAPTLREDVEIFNFFSPYGALGVMGAFIGVGVGYLLAEFLEDKGVGDPSKAAILYYPFCAFIGFGVTTGLIWTT
jgi:hypothetical protein